MRKTSRPRRSRTTVPEPPRIIRATPIVEPTRVRSEPQGLFDILRARREVTRTRSAGRTGPATQAIELEGAKE